MKATSRQTWAYFCATGYDLRGVKDLTAEQASKLLQDASNGIVTPPEGAVLKGGYKKAEYMFIRTADGAIAKTTDGSIFTITGAKEAKIYAKENGFSAVKR